MKLFNPEEDDYIIESSFGFSDEFKDIVNSLFEKYQETGNFEFIDSLLEFDNAIEGIVENFLISSIIQDGTTIVSGKMIVNTDKFKQNNNGAIRNFLEKMAELYNDNELKLYLNI